MRAIQPIYVEGERWKGDALNQERSLVSALRGSTRPLYRSGFENLTPLTPLFLSCMDERDVVTNVCLTVGSLLVR